MVRPFNNLIHITEITRISSLLDFQICAMTYPGVTGRSRCCRGVGVTLRDRSVTVYPIRDGTLGRWFEPLISKCNIIHMSICIRQFQKSFSSIPPEIQLHTYIKMLPVNFFGEATSSKEIYGSLIYDCIIPSNWDNLCQQVHENKQTYS